MRLKFIAFAFAMSIALNTSAQGNLQFNQVINVRDVSETVPAGKVWKIESYQQAQVSVSQNSITNCSDLGRERPYYVDGNRYHNIRSVGTGSTNLWRVARNEFPIWLKEGQTANTTCPEDFLSIIEFNIVP